MMRHLARTVFVLSGIYCLLILSGFVFSYFLPHFFDFSSPRGTACYWTDALVAFVECGKQVPARAVFEWYFNFWLGMIYRPMFGFGTLNEKLILFSIVEYAPVIYFIWYPGRRILR